MNKRLITLVAVVALIVSGLSAQGRRGLKINEVMVCNDSSVVDDYGRHSAWVELFNSTFAPLEISSVFLTNDSTQKTLYPVPLGDVNTKIPKRQHVVFWTDGRHTDGTFHTNFTLTPGQPNWIGIYDADGKTLIDSVTIPADLAANTSYARVKDGEGTGLEAWEVRYGTETSYVTPSSANRIKGTNPKIQQFSQQDKDGFGMTIMAMCIVFSALLLLSVCFYIISRIGIAVSKRNKSRSQASTPVVDAVAAADGYPSQDSGEEIAAIVMALHEHLDAHDRENTVLTINKVRRAYSPWSSKIYGLRETPRR